MITFCHISLAKHTIIPEPESFNRRGSIN